MSNQSRLDESNLDNKTKEIRLILQIVKSVTIDKYSTILDIKKLARQQFNKYADDFNLQIKDYDITSLDNMNAFRTLDYYKSNIISVNPKSLKKLLNESNIVSKVNSDLDNSQTFFDTKDKISERYLANRANIKKYTNEELLKINQFSNNDDVINRSQMDQKFNHREVDLPDNYSNIGNNRFINNPLFSPIRVTSNLNTYQSNVNENEAKQHLMRNANKSQLYSSSDSLFSQENIRGKENIELRSKSSVSPIPLSERIKQYGINPIISSNNQREKSFTNDPLFSTQEKDYQIVKEEIENLSITNKILNKSNLELKHHIRSIEEERENEKEIRYKLIQANKVIEELKNNIITLQRANQEMNEKLENLKKNSSDLVSENKKSFSEIENLNKNFEMLDKNNFELKNQIESLEEINKRQETEKFNLINQLNEKEKIISELQEKIRCLNELNSTTRKSCRDYEDMLKGMKRTIDIMKKSNDDSDAEMMRVKINLDEAKENLVKRNDEYECLEKIKSSLQNEIEMLKNEILFLANENNNKDKNINDSSSNMRNIFAENERLKLKLDNFNKIIEEKDISIENMKISVLSLNRNLEESKTEIDSLKRRLNDEMIEKNKLSRNRDQHDYNFSEYKKQIEELTRLKDNLYKQNFALEEDNVENRNKYYQIRNENEQLNMKINFLNETIKELQMDVLKANSNKNNTDQEKDNLNLKITDMQSLLNQAKSSEFSLKNDIDNLNSKILSKERTIESLLRSKDELNNEIFNLKEKLAISANEKLKIIEDCDNNYNEIQLNEIKSRKEHEKISNELRSKDNFIENLQKTIHEINNRLNDFSTQREKERVIFEKNIEDLKKRLMESVEREKILKIEKEDCSNDLKYRIKFIESLENRLNELGESVMNLKKSNDKLNIENLEFLEKIEEFKQNNNDLQEKLEKANQKNDLLSINLEELKNIQQEILNKNSSLQKEFVYYKNINDKLESKINYLENNNTFNITRNKPDMILSSSSNNNTGSNNIYKRTDKNKTNDAPREENYNSHLKPFQQNDPKNSGEFYTKPDEIQSLTIEINSKFEKKRKDKIDLFDGAKVIFNIFDKKRIIRFDLENHVFKVIDFADFGGFEQNYLSKNSFSLNVLDGLLIITGENSDQLYHYSHNKHAMNKLANLNSDHENGCLLYDEYGNSLFCLGGRKTRSVERYVNEEISLNYMKKGKLISTYSSESQLKNTWQKYPDLNIERIMGSFIVIDKHIYGLFGFSSQSNRYLDSIERLNLESPMSWEFVSFKKNENISCFKKNFAASKFSNDEILLIGGIDGFNEYSSENYSIFSVKKNEFYYLDDKLNQTDSFCSYDFHRNPISIQAFDINNNCFHVSIDERDTVHIIDSKTMQHMTFNSLE